MKGVRALLVFCLCIVDGRRLAYSELVKDDLSEQGNQQDGELLVHAEAGGSG